jgi:hypothetical protein
VSGHDLPLTAGATLSVATREDQRIRAQVELRPDLEGPIERGARLGKVVVLVDGRVAGRAAALAGRSIPAGDGAGLIERADDAIPGPRAVLLAGAGLIAAAILLRIAVPPARRWRAG